MVVRSAKYYRDNFVVVPMGNVDLFGAAAVIVASGPTRICFTKVKGLRRDLLAAKTTTDLADINRDFFVKMIASDVENDAVAKSALDLSRYFNMPVRVVPSRTSSVQMPFNVTPNDSWDNVAAKAVFPRTSMPGLASHPA